MRTQADREFDWNCGRELERKDAEIERLRAALDGLLAMVDYYRDRGQIKYMAGSPNAAAVHQALEALGRVPADNEQQGSYPNDLTDDQRAYLREEAEKRREAWRKHATEQSVRSEPDRLDDKTVPGCGSSGWPGTDWG